MEGVLDSTAKLVEDADVASSARIAESKLALHFPTHPAVNDPTAGQKAALAGTVGVPSDSNRYVTESDPRLVAESFESGLLLVPPSGMQTATISLGKDYAAPPRVMLSWKSTSSTMFRESFETGTVGEDVVGWTYYPLAGHGGTFKTATGQVGEIRPSGGEWAGGFIYEDPEASWADFELSFDIAAMPGNRFIVGFRCSANGCYWLQVLPGQADECRLLVGARNYIENLSVLARATASSSVTHARLVARGKHLQVFLNDASAPILDVTDSTHSRGGIGLSAFSSGWSVDNLVVSNSAGPDVMLFIKNVSATEVEIGVGNHNPQSTETGHVQGIIVP